MEPLALVAIPPPPPPLPPAPFHRPAGAVPVEAHDPGLFLGLVRAHHGRQARGDVPQRFALGGDSAGAYYAVFAAATAAIPAFDGPAPVCPAASGEVKAVVAQCGCYDLLRMAPPPEA